MEGRPARPESCASDHGLLVFEDHGNYASKRHADRLILPNVLEKGILEKQVSSLTYMLNRVVHLISSLQLHSLKLFFRATGSTSSQSTLSLQMMFVQIGLQLIIAEQLTLLCV